ncbi:LPS-assembly protein LptD [Hansschlegelia sp. KR7-227]|uniref:LPS-assembly protein LptD n=1 Tax=Hansschlegelia sp. KR7-227 TaxID=3400914 RepID=UPI003C07D752
MTLAPRRSRPMRSAGRRLLFATLLGSAGLALGHAPTSAQVYSNDVLPPLPDGEKRKHGFETLPRNPVDKRLKSAKAGSDEHMLMEAKELVYDYDREVVTAVGKVDIYYQGRALQADRVAYDQKNNRVKAMGSVKLTERDGNIVYADQLDVTDDFRDGFVSPLRLETTNRTHFAAARGRRENGTLSVFDRGVYTACEPCRENPQKPPLWQVKAKRIIWREDEKMIYYEDATFELFGQPIAWLPYFSSPDPTVKRKSGVLAPSLARSGDVGYSVEVPYFWALSPSSDLTLAPVVTQKQGVMLKGEFRQELIDGAYSIRAAGISQTNSDKFSDKVPLLINGVKPQDAGLSIGPGDKKERWAFETKGHFDINEKWSWGWDVNLVSDKWVRGDYDLWGSSYDATSSLYLIGQGDRSWFELRGYTFYGMTRYDQQDRLPWAAPVLDYEYTFENPVVGGELSFDINAATIHRDESDYARYRTRLQPRPENALIGAAGTYSRLSGEVQWRRQFIDPIGQVWTPFAFARGDLIYTDPKDDPRMGPFLDTRQDAAFRGMAGVGLEYRFPFIAESSFGTHQVEPIAQLLLRPNEGRIGKLPNEDAQSLIFDDTTLFAWNKFSGYDRIEGGSRANVGAQYTFTADSGASFTMLAGQSYQLFGRNSYKSFDDPTRIGPDSGLDERSSDYVAGATLVPNQHLAFASHFRFDDRGFDLRSAEVEGRATFERVQANLIYGRYDEQPLQGYDDIREGVLGGARIFVTEDAYVEGGARYNFDREVFDRTQVGFGINDIQQCLSLGFSYIREIDNSAETIKLDKVDHKFLLRVDLRTLGGGTVTTRSKQTRNDDMFGSNQTFLAQQPN